MVRVGSAAAIALALFAVACEYALLEPTVATDGISEEYVWQLPEGFPIPRVPADNPMTPAKVELGRLLFHDTRLSGDGTVSCASCHRPELAYSDGRDRAVGVRESVHPRSAMSLTNVAYNATLGWDDPGLTRLEDQALVPLLNTRPPEMGVYGREQEVLARFKKSRRYRRLFSSAFPRDNNPVTMRNVTYALASFERTLIAGNSPYDRWAYGGQTDALNEDQRAGARLFFSQRLSCFRCHAGFNLSGPVVYEGAENPLARFHHTGLYNEDGSGAYPEPNTGVHRHSRNTEDMGKFRAPTLRNIALTAPYMHDGSIATLEDVVDHYAAGGRARYAHSDIKKSEPAAVIDPLVKGFELSPEQRSQLIAFLHALTDETFVRKALEQAKQ